MTEAKLIHFTNFKKAKKLAKENQIIVKSSCFGNKTAAWYIP